MQSETFYKKVYGIFLTFLFIAVAAILKICSSVFIPLTLAVLLSLVFYPLVKTMHECKAHIPWVVGVIVVMLISLVVCVIVGNLLATSIKTIVTTYPKYESKFMTMYTWICDLMKIPVNQDESFINNLWNTSKIRSMIQNSALSVSNGLVNFVKDILLIMLFEIFLLIEMKNITYKAKEAFPKESTFHKATIIGSNIIAQVTHFISIKFCVSAITGILVYFSCLFIHMDFAIVWGFLAFVLNFIPNFGSITSWAVTTIFAILQFFPHWGQAVYIAVMLLAINMIIGNFIEPHWEGHDLGLSPFVILIMLSVWFWMWGFVGAILAVPITVILRIVFENIDELKPVAILLGNGRKYKEKARKEKAAEKDAISS